MQTTAFRTQSFILAVADIAGFALRCRELEDWEIMTALDRFYEAAGTHVEDAGGTVVKCMGDAVFAAFPQQNAAETVRALSELQHILDADSLNPVLKGCSVHVRVHAGPAACGQAGPRGMKRYDIVGNVVNELFMMRGKGFSLSETARALLPAGE